MNTPFFSILIPVYNVERYLDSCIQSVLSQNFKDFEIILIDDGSTDRSGDLCDKYLSRSDNIHVIHKKNGGLISARRIGLKVSKGRYILFLDSDDFLDENTLERLHEIIEQTKCDIITFKWKRVDEKGIVINEMPSAFNQSSVVSKITYFEKMLSSSLLNSLCLKCCRRDLFDIEMDYTEYYGMQNGEDLLQSLPVVKNADIFYFLNEALYNYRVNVNSITHNYQRKQYQVLKFVRPFVFDYMCQMRLNTDENLNLFYNFYLSVLWDNLLLLNLGLKSNFEKIRALDEINSYPHVKSANIYLKCCNLGYLKKTGIKLFYSGNRKLFFAYLKIICKAYRFKR